jgi:hypothetical protein
LWTLVEERRVEMARKPDEEIRRTAERAMQERDLPGAEAKAGGGTGTVRAWTQNSEPFHHIGPAVLRAGSARL